MEPNFMLRTRIHRIHGSSPNASRATIRASRKNEPYLRETETTRVGVR
jgi:hypothetical protein